MLKEGLAMLAGSNTAKALVMRTPLRGMARRFVPGEGVGELLAALHEANRLGLVATANYLGEAVRDERTAGQAASAYKVVLERIFAEGIDANVSLKFTQLGQDISERVLDENLRPILEHAKASANFIRFDMESSAYTQRTLDAFEKLWAEGWRNIGVVLQAYLLRSADDVRRMNELGARVRLCKGAYVEPAEIAYQGDLDVRRNFLRLMRILLDEGNHPAIATHDERLIEETLNHVETHRIPREHFELQMLYGVRRDLQRQCVKDGYAVRVYVPFGEEWYPYLMRRLAERPANVLLVAGSVVRESPLGSLLKRAKAGNGRRKAG